MIVVLVLVVVVLIPVIIVTVDITDALALGVKGGTIGPPNVPENI